MAYWHFPRYVTVAEKRERAERKLKKLQKKKPNIQPVILEGRTLATTWWGKAWNQNLERYADYANRIGRGRSYVRHLAVLDLQIVSGKVTALVQGSAARPYRVEIRIKPLGRKRWREMKAACAGKFDSLSDLLAGKFPKALETAFTARGKGLFPSPAEIQLSCSCPDWAVMCKHVAAALYGIGARLDKDPGLFFKLRKVKMEDLVAEAVTETAQQLLQRANRKKERVIDDADIGDVFGIVMEDPVDFAKETPPAPKVPKRSPAAGKNRKKIPSADSRKRVLAMIGRSKKGIDVSRLQAKTGIDKVKIRNIIAAAHKKGIIERVARGLYRQRAAKPTPAEAAGAVLSLINASQTDVAIAVIKAKTGIPDARVRYIVSRALAQGKIRRIARGRYAKKSSVGGRHRLSDVVYEALRRSRKGLNVAQLQEKTGLAEIQVRNAVFRLSKQNRIQRVQRGVYAAK